MDKWQVPVLSYPNLNEYADDLTLQISRGEITPSREVNPLVIERMMVILQRSRKRCPVLIGDNEVLKIAAVQAVAAKVVHGDVPDKLREHHIFTLNTEKVLEEPINSKIIADRLKTILTEVSNVKDHIILYFSNSLHLMACVETPEVRRLLVPGTAGGEIQSIGTLTVEQFVKYILSDAALNRLTHEIVVAD